MYLNDPIFNIVDSVGAPISGAKAYFYLTGTTTLVNTYTTVGRTVANTNPVIADSAGRFPPIYLDPDITYRMQLKDASDILIADRDPIAVAGGEVFQAESIAALRLLTTATAATQLFLLYNYVAGDGGGAFRYDSTDTTTADNNGTVIVDAASRRWKRQYDGAVNVKWFGARGNGVANDATAINAAIAVLGAAGGDVIFPPGNYRVTATIIANTPVHLLGSGSGSVYQPAQSPAVSITWAGAANADVIRFGGFGTLVSGGGIEDIYINGAAIADHGLRIKDSQRAYFKGVTITGTLAVGLLLENTVTLDPTGFHIFDDLRIQLRGGSTDSARGIYVNGSNSGGAEGVTLCTFRRTRIDHANGAGVEIGRIGDAFTWDALQTFRADVESGVGVWFSGTGTQICGSHTFLAPLISAGFRFDTTDSALQTNIINAHGIDVNTGVAVTNLVRGAGSDFARAESGLGWAYGSALIAPMHAFKRRDACALIRFDSANSVLHTADGNWKTQVDGGGSIAENGQVGSGLDLTTGSTAGNITAMYDNATIGGGMGYASSYGFAGQWLVAPVASADVVMRFGWADGTGASPSNGIYLEYAPASSANWRLVCVASGTSTVITSSVAVQVLAKQDLYIYVRPDGLGASAYMRAANNRLYAVIGAISTNIPSAPISALASIRTTAAAAKRVDVYGIKLGATDEV